MIAIRRIIHVMIYLRLILLLALLAGSPGRSLAEDSLEAIDYLIGYVGKSDATFIRNGDPHPAAEAVNHLRAKYIHFKAQIKTPEDFIRLAASRSLVTGRPYLVKLKDGRQLQVQDWLEAALKEYRASLHQSP